MERVVQQNAAAAEESAAASEEMNVQAAQMRNMADDLVILVEVLAQGKDLKPKVYPRFTSPPSSVRRPTGSLPHLRGGFQ
jgi:methyl-accepting chemotaxis protein